MASLVIVALALISLAARCHGVHDRISTQIRSNKLVISAALAQYLDSKNGVTLEIAAEIDNTKRLINSIPEITAVLPEDILNYFYVGASRTFYAVEQFKSIDPSLTELYNSLTMSFGKNGQLAFQRCVATNNLERNFNQIIQSLNQRLFQLGLEEFAFKGALTSCSSNAVVLARKTPECIANVLTRNPYPKFNNSGLQTVQSLQKLYDCLIVGVERAKLGGENVVSNLKTRLPQELQYLLPESFEGRFQPSIALPSTNRLLTPPSEITNKLEAVKAAWAKAKDTYDEAVSTKGYTLDAAINHLKLEQDVARSFINKSQEAATLEEQPCFVAAKVAAEASVATNANKWLQCISDGQIPTSHAVAALEMSLKEREIKEKALTPLVDCAKRTENLFDTDLIWNCIVRAQEEYLSFLVEFELKTEVLRQDSSDFLRQEDRCHCDADMQARRDVREEIYKLRTCVTRTSNIRFLSPEDEPCILSRCTQRN